MTIALTTPESKAATPGRPDPLFTDMIGGSSVPTAKSRGPFPKFILILVFLVLCNSESAFAGDFKNRLGASPLLLSSRDRVLTLVSAQVDSLASDTDGTEAQEQDTPPPQTDDATPVDELETALPDSSATKSNEIRLFHWENTQVQAEVEYLNVLEATNPVFEQEDYITRLKTYSDFEITDNLNLLLDTDIIFDEEKNIFDREERFLYRQGLNIDLLKLQYSRERLSLFAGRYEPASEIFPESPTFFGNYSNYTNLDVKIGLGGAVRLSNDSSNEHWLTLHLLHVDTSVLSAPLLSGEDEVDKEDGGTGNTEKFDNGLLTLHGSPNFGAGRIDYVLGYGEQQPGIDLELVEKMSFGALYGVIEPSDRFEIELGLEHLDIENANNNPEDHSTVTVSAYYNRWPLGIGLAYSERKVTPNDASDEEATGRIVEIVVRYWINDQWSLESALETIDETDFDETLFGVVLVYGFDEVVLPATTPADRASSRR